jgi:hypothetical protein
MRQRLTLLTSGARLLQTIQYNIELEKLKVQVFALARTGVERVSKLGR